MPNLPNSDLVNHTLLDKQEAKARMGEAAAFSDFRERIDPMIELYFPVLKPCVHAMMAVFGSMSLAARTRPSASFSKGRLAPAKAALLRCLSHCPTVD